MLTLGKTAALASSARSATVQQARARLLGERIDLARELHERVMQRLFGISLVLGSSTDLGPDERVRCARRDPALRCDDLRSALSRPLAPSPEGTGATLRGGARAARSPLRGAAARGDLGDGASRCPMTSSRWPSRCWPRRCETPTSTPLRAGCTSTCAGGTTPFVLEVRNDGVDPRRAGTARRRGHGPAAGGLRGPAARRRGRVRKGGRRVAHAPDAPGSAERPTGGCGSWWPTTTRSSTGASACC